MHKSTYEFGVQTANVESHETEVEACDLYRNESNLELQRLRMENQALKEMLEKKRNEEKPA